MILSNFSSREITPSAKNSSFEDVSSALFPSKKESAPSRVSFRRKWLEYSREPYTSLPFANITGLTSRGLPAEFRDENFRRKMFWPKPMWGIPKLHEIRVALTETADGKPLTLEVLLGKNNGTEWFPFYFHREGDLWVRDTHVGGVPVEQKCITCHASDGKGIVPYGKLSPRPYFLKEEKDFLGVGYIDPDLIKRFLEF